MDLLANIEAQAAAAAAWPGVAPAPPPWEVRPEPLNVAQAFVLLPAALQGALSAAGATAPGTIRCLCDGSRDDAEQAIDMLLPGLAQAERTTALESLLWLIRLAGPEAARKRRQYANLDPGTLLQEHLAGAALKQARVERDQVITEVQLADAAWRPAVRPSRFRTRTDARLAALPSPAAREEAEQRERSRWKEVLVELIREAGGPVVDATRGARNPDAALAAAAGGRRARTLAKRVGSWRRVRAWCMDLYSVPFPRTVMHLIEYVQARADEPCGLSVLEGVAAGFVFMEECCGYAKGQRLADAPLFSAYLKELIAGYASPGKEPTRQAPRYPLALVLALEREVIDPGVAACYRCHAWWHLLSLWASLRFDDHRGLAPGSVQITGRGLEAVLSRTKTTGPGKRVDLLPLVVGFDAYLACPSWLVAGWELWQRTAPFVRDHFLVKPAPSLDAMQPVELTYEQASRLSRAVLSGLPREDDVMQAIGDPIVGLFTQHSARCWLASLAALVKVPEADLSFLGRWSPTTAKGYVRTATEVVMRVQATVARRVRHDLMSAADHPIGEQAAYLELRRELRRRNFRDELIGDHLGELQAWTGQLALDLLVASGRQEPSAVEELVDVMDELPEVEAEKDVDAEGLAQSLAPPTPPVFPESGPEPPPPLPVHEEPCGLPESGYVVSLSRSGWRRLHRLGGCTRHPGVHYLRFELLGEERPRPDDYDDHCKQCWRSGGPEVESDEEESESEPEEGDAPLLVDEAAGGEVPLAELNF